LGESGIADSYPRITDLVSSQSTNRANVVSLEDTFTIMQQRNKSPESLNYQPRLWKNNVSYSLMH